MKTIEELKAMTQEELVIMIQNLQDDLEKNKASENFWFRERNKMFEKYNSLKNVIKGVVAIIE